MGNTEYVAKTIQETVGGDLFRIETVDEYSLDHDPLVDQAAGEQDAGQAHEIIQYVDAAIGMTTSVSDEAACTFAAQFYSSLGFGLSVKKAFEQAKGVMMLESPTEANTPILYIKDGIDADMLFIVKPASCFRYVVTI